MFTYSIMAYHAAETLDKYNCSKEIEFCRNSDRKDAWDIRNHISALHNTEVEDALEELSLGEFMEYMSVRYRIQWEEIITYKMI